MVPTPKAWVLSCNRHEFPEKKSSKGAKKTRSDPFLFPSLPIPRAGACSARASQRIYGKHLYLAHSLQKARLDWRVEAPVLLE